jgi:Glycosyltransferase family 87
MTAGPHAPGPRRSRTALRVGWIFGLALLAATVLIVTALTHPIWFGDADWYATGLPALGGHQPLYPADYLVPHQAVRPPQFNLPPAVVLISPLAGLGRVPWGALMAVALVAGLALLWPRLPEPWGLVLAAALIVLPPVVEAFVVANLNSLVFLLVVVAARWPRRAGWAIGVATALKLTPVFLFAWLIGRRDWRGVAFGAGVAVSLTVIAAVLTQPAALWDFVLVRWYEQPTNTLGNLSLASFGLPVWVGYGLALVLAIAAARRGSLALAIAASLMAVPTLHLHYWLLALVPLLQIGRWPYAVELPMASRPNAGVASGDH